MKTYRITIMVANTTPCVTVIRASSYTVWMSRVLKAFNATGEVVYEAYIAEQGTGYCVQVIDEASPDEKH